MAYLRCPECRLTAPAAAYYLRGDQCPRCLTAMEPVDRFRDTPVRVPEPSPKGTSLAATAGASPAR